MLHFSDKSTNPVFMVGIILFVWSRRPCVQSLKFNLDFFLCKVTELENSFTEWVTIHLPFEQHAFYPEDQSISIFLVNLSFKYWREGGISVAVMCLPAAGTTPGSGSLPAEHCRVQEGEREGGSQHAGEGAAGAGSHVKGTWMLTLFENENKSFCPSGGRSLWWNRVSSLPKCWIFSAASPSSFFSSFEEVYNSI